MSSFNFDDYKDQNKRDLMKQIEELTNQLKQEMIQGAHWKSKYLKERPILYNESNKLFMENHYLLVRMKTYEKQQDLLRNKIFSPIDRIKDYFKFIFTKPIIAYLCRA